MPCNMIDIFIRPHSFLPLFVRVGIWLPKNGHKGKDSNNYLKWGGTQGCQVSRSLHYWLFSRIYFKTCIHACIEQFVSFVMHFPISKQIFETEFENQKKIRFPNEYYIVPLYTPAPFVDVILVSFVLQTKVPGFGHSLFYILDLGSVFYCYRAKIESAFQILAVDL